MGIEKPPSTTPVPVAREAEAPADVWNAGCPSRRVLELVANKWALLVIPLLRGRPRRNNELLRQVGGISQKMLTQTLRDLELNGLVLRDDRQTVPPHVEYRLSALGLSLSKTLLAVDRWAESNHAEIDRAQREARARL
ncbi:DNA-binding HxlR family transcriptional regulator [Variovorax boronicumulans]|uniref:winged helix-turn-helix transcriptional regulator n=1 Tax=Variovorax boronicumulans TaxID=436515 RepID=UPI002475C011|nr:helix-turn-helix domain-containing protein [Variovorax boronicumulans]MDH6165387.1 DNA-binding HxlR family transcriptional regulator [Variovorax boronicumulans]